LIPYINTNKSHQQQLERRGAKFIIKQQQQHKFFFSFFSLFSKSNLTQTSTKPRNSFFKPSPNHSSRSKNIIKASKRKEIKRNSKLKSSKM
jgi:hypothetical protein